MEQRQTQEGIFFLHGFDKIRTGSDVPYNKIIIENIPGSEFDEEKHYVFYQQENTAIYFSNLIKKPDGFSDTWSYTAYENLQASKKFTYEKIYYGIFEDKKLVKILELDRDCLLKKFKEKKGNTERYNIPQNAAGLEFRQVYPKPSQE